MSRYKTTFEVRLLDEDLDGVVKRFVSRLPGGCECDVKDNAGDPTKRTVTVTLDSVELLKYVALEVGADDVVVRKAPKG